MMIEAVTQEEIQELTALYALDALTQREAREVEARLAADDQKTEVELRAFEKVVASLSFAAPEAEPSAEAKDKLFARIASEKKAATKPTYITPTMTEALREIWHVRAEEGKWKPYSEGVLMKMLMVDKNKGTITTLLKIEPGAHIVRHRHHGLEECYVLEGDFNIGDQQYGPGDYQYALPGSVHPKIYSNHGALVLLIAPVEFEAIV